MRRVLIATAAGTALLTGGSALAANPATTTFPVSATVVKTCSVSATALAFGNYTPGSGAATGTSTVNVLCTKSTSFTVALNGGTTTGGTISQRLLVNGTNILQYNLYTDSNRTILWGDGTTGVAPTGTGLGTGTAVPFTVYGNLPDNATNQAALPGLTYNDLITVSVAY